MRQIIPKVLIASALIAGSNVGLAPHAVSETSTARPAQRHIRRAPQPKAARALEVDHVMIHVTPGAPERAALERAGFRIAPDVNHHEGQGSASITVEFGNSFLELVWRDDSVEVAPGLEKIAERFQRQGQWRTSGWSPFGIGLRRSASGPDSLPFPTREVRGPWMEPGAKLEIISPANDTLGPRIFVVPRTMAANGLPDSDSERRRLSQRETFEHANGARRISSVKVLGPQRGMTPATHLVAQYSPVVFAVATHWALDVTFDRGAKGVTRDLRPDLPLVVHF